MSAAVETTSKTDCLRVARSDPVVVCAGDVEMRRGSCAHSRRKNLRKDCNCQFDRMDRGTGAVAGARESDERKDVSMINRNKLRTAIALLLFSEHSAKNNYYQLPEDLREGLSKEDAFERDGVVTMDNPKVKEHCMRRADAFVDVVMAFEEETEGDEKTIDMLTAFNRMDLAEKRAFLICTGLDWKQEKGCLHACTNCAAPFGIRGCDNEGWYTRIHENGQRYRYCADCKIGIQK